MAKPTTVTKPTFATPVLKTPTLSLADALLTLEYLGVTRKVLCTKCGYRLGVLENTFNRHCDSCKLEQNYTPTKGINVLDRALCQSLDVWVKTFLDGSSEA